MRYERIEVNIFDRHFECGVSVLAAAALRAADVLPVGCFIAGSEESVALDKRFE